MVSISAQLDRRTKQHTQFRVSASNGSRDMALTKSWRKKKKEIKKKNMNTSNPIKHPQRGIANNKNKNKNNKNKNNNNNNDNNETGSRSPCMRLRSDPRK